MDQARRCRSEITPRTGLAGARRRFLASAGLTSAIADRGHRPDRRWRLPPPSPDSPFFYGTWSHSHNNYYEFSTAKDVVWKIAEAFEPPALDVDGRRRGRKAADMGPGSSARSRVRAGRPGLSTALRRRMVDGDSLARISAWLRFFFEAAQPRASARPLRESSSPSFRPSGDDRSAPTRPHAWPYHGRRCASTRRCMNCRCSSRAVYGQAAAPIRTVRRCGSPCRGSTGSRVPRRSSRSAWSNTKGRRRAWKPGRAASEYGFFGNVNPAVPPPTLVPARRSRLGELGKHDNPAVQWLRGAGGCAVRRDGPARQHF